MYSTSDQNRVSEAGSGIRCHNGDAGSLDAERAAIEKTLLQTGNSQHKTAHILGMPRSRLLLKVNSYRAQDAADRIHRLAHADPAAHWWPQDLDES